MEISKNAESDYRDIKVKFQNLKNDPQEHLFGGLELKCRYLSLEWKKNFFEKTISLAYRLINDYGISISRPAWVLLASMLSFVAIHYCLGMFNPEWFDFKDHFGPVKIPETSALITGIFGSLGPLRLLGNVDFLEHKSIIFNSILWLETIWSSLLWFFIIFGIRRRFKTH